MTMMAKVFQNGRSQAIRIPKEFRMDDDEVCIEKLGDTLIIRPVNRDRWDMFFEALEGVDTAEFLATREQLPPQNREIF